MRTFENAKGKEILLKIVKGIQANKDYLGEIDGLIGDGDHGMNMNKGFTLFERRFGDSNISFTDGMNELGMILFSEIGGSMGPIYGTIFMDAATSQEGVDNIGLKELYEMWSKGLAGLQDIVEARVGDKTLVDTLSPAVESLKASLDNGVELEEAMLAMKEAAKIGMESTKAMQAKFGRSSRLGERSIGVLDAGACSCYIILSSMAEAIASL